MTQALVYLATSFWLGAVHAATPGHGKTIAAAYIVGMRGRPVDAVILGIFVTLSHTSGIVLVAVLASLGSSWLVPQRIETYIALFTGLLVIAIGIWMLWTQRGLLKKWNLDQSGSDRYSQGGRAPVRQAAAAEHRDAPGHLQYRAHSPGPAGNVAQSHAHRYRHAHGDHQHDDHSHEHPHDHAHDHTRDAGQDHSHDHAQATHQHAFGETAVYHSHGWGLKHTHDIDLVTQNRPKLLVLLGLGIAGGLLPDPAALAILLSALAQGKVMLGLGTVLVFSLGFAATLVVVGVVAAKVGQKILEWLSGPWAIRAQILTSVVIVMVGLILTFQAWRTLNRLI